jgi:hypothetical protein
LTGGVNFSKAIIAVFSMKDKYEAETENAGIRSL